MKLEVDIDSSLLSALQSEAQRRGSTVSQVVEEALQRLFWENDALPPLPTFDSGGTLVDIASRSQLYDVMEGR